MVQSRRIKAIASYTVLIIWTLIIGVPIYWLVITAFKDSQALFAKTTYIPWVDFQPTLHAFEDVFITQGLLSSKPLINSVLVSLITAGASTVIGGAAGYALARFRFRVGPLTNESISIGFLAQRMFPPAVLLIPFLIMYKTLHLLDTRIGLILVYCAFSVPFVVWVMRDFFAGLPIDIEESALIDGCGRVGVLFRIAIPLAAPGFVSAFVLTMIGAWNEFLLALAFMFNRTVTIPLFLTYQISITEGTEYWNMAVIALFAVLPVVIAGLSLERYITRGLTYGAVK